jgi:hypothetical protein
MNINIQFSSTEQTAKPFLNYASNHSKGTRHNNDPTDLKEINLDKLSCGDSIESKDSQFLLYRCHHIHKATPMLLTNLNPKQD